MMNALVMHRYLTIEIAFRYRYNETHSIGRLNIDVFDPRAKVLCIPIYNKFLDSNADKNCYSKSQID